MRRTNDKGWACAFGARMGGDKKTEIKKLDILTLICFYAFMNTRITIDLGEPRLFTLLKLTAAQSGKSIREIVVASLESYMSHSRENRALLKMAEKTFAEWDNPKDSEYDKLSTR